MTDVVDRKTRSRMMSGIRGKDTKPELRVRSYLHRQGFRFRLHKSELPGKPDIVIAKYSAVIFVHGCFWHRHEGCKLSYTPKSNLTFWTVKFRANKLRDLKVQKELRKLGWRVFVVWTCSADDENLAELSKKIVRSKRNPAAPIR